MCLRQFVCLLLLAWPLFYSPARADGYVFAQAAPTKTPDQRALLQYANGVERLVIETSFIGQGSNFAWVVPLPSAPKVEAVSTNFFQYLNLAYQPELVIHVSGWWVLFLLGTFFVSVAVASFMAYSRQGPRRFLYWLLSLAILSMLLAFLIPNFVVARGLGVYSPPVQVLNQQTVGIYDTVTLSGTNGTALVAWLNANGFKTPPSAQPIIASYAAQGWVFVAAKINRNASVADSIRPHPLAYSFPTEKPVYPLRLTGVENPHCTIEMFVFGPAQAEIPGFHTEYCGVPSKIGPLLDEYSQSMESFGPSKPGEFKFGNPEVLRYAFPAAATTKLVGTLAASQMRSDAWIYWAPVTPSHPVLYRRDVAIALAIYWMLGVMVYGVIALQIWLKIFSRKLGAGAGWAIIALGLACGSIRYATIQTSEIAFAEGGPHAAINHLRNLDGCLDYLFIEGTNANSFGVPFSESAALSAINGYGGLKNAFTLQPMRIEASPGNITFQTASNGVDIYWYDIQGTPQKVGAILNNDRKLP